MVSLAFGLFLVYIWGPEMKEVYVFPTPENVGRVQYKDKADNCFTYRSAEVDCPTDETMISEVPVQQ
jgi:hypothetical protein